MRWSRPLGVVLIAAALAAALDPDYPVPTPTATRSTATPSSAAAAFCLEPRALSPRGGTAAGPPRFCWSWNGPGNDFEVVLLDEGLDELHRVVVQGLELEPAGPLLRLLEGGGRFHWYVVADPRGRRFRSAPAAFRF